MTLIEQITKLTELDLQDLIHALEDHLHKNQMSHLMNRRYDSDIEDEIEGLKDDIYRAERKQDDAEYEKILLEDKIEDAKEVLTTFDKFTKEDFITLKSILS